MPTYALIPHKAINIDQLNELAKGSLSDLMGMKVTEVTEDSLTMEMDVRKDLQQPYGILHGGALASLAENAGSLASKLVIDKGYHCVGLSLNCNHIKAVRLGKVKGTAKAIHLGRSTHIWEIEIVDQDGRLVNVSRLTMMIIQAKDGQ